MGRTVERVEREKKEAMKLMEGDEQISTRKSMCTCN